MAMLDKYPYLNVEILVDNISFQEYDDDDGEPDENTITIHIEAKSGAFFEVRVDVITRASLNTT